MRREFVRQVLRQDTCAKYLAENDSTYAGGRYVINVGDETRRLQDRSQCPVGVRLWRVVCQVRSRIFSIPPVLTLITGLVYEELAASQSKLNLL